MHKYITTSEYRKLRFLKQMSTTHNKNKFYYNIQEFYKCFHY